MYTFDHAVMNEATAVISNRSALNCSEAFFLSNGTCFPRCDKWKQYSDDVSTAADVVVIGTSAVRVMLGTIALVASCVNWRQM